VSRDGGRSKKEKEGGKKKDLYNLPLIFNVTIKEGEGGGNGSNESFLLPFEERKAEEKDGGGLSTVSAPLQEKKKGETVVPFFREGGKGKWYEKGGEKKKSAPA